jgi:hypothetical protein
MQAQARHGTTTCASCHSSQSMDQSLTPMGLALALPGSNPILKSHAKLSVRKGAYTYVVETHGDESTYSVSDDIHTITVPIRWGFGAHAQTWLLERDGKFYESLVSFYPTIDGLDTTTGDEKLQPHTLEEAFGREQTDDDTRACFGCHASDTQVNGKLHLESLKPGLTCVRCHSGADTHMAEISLKKLTPMMPEDLGALSSEGLSNFCGQCHRPWDMVVRSHWRGSMNVRFQPYRLANSRCFSGTDPRISCVACHDPHKNLVHTTTSYDAKCLACHASSTPLVPVAMAETPKICPVAKADCVSCHMPKVTLPGGSSHLTFTDHQIRIVRPGDSYPN